MTITVVCGRNVPETTSTNVTSRMTTTLLACDGCPTPAHDARLIAASIANVRITALKIVLLAVATSRTKFCCEATARTALLIKQPQVASSATTDVRHHAGARTDLEGATISGEPERARDAVTRASGRRQKAP